MIDDPIKTGRLIADLKASLPVATNIPADVARLLSEKSPDVSIPSRCNVVDLFYMGDEGGIVCALDIGGPEAKQARLISITALAFDRKAPCAREIETYQRHREKKLKRLHGRGY